MFSMLLKIAAVALTSTVLFAASDAEARNRPRVWEHRPGAPGVAIPGSYSIRCVIPFCYHDFQPRGRPRVQDHRQIPPHHSPPRRPGR